ncbi:MAG: hypothetical protein Q8K86_09610 [Candidatus Nanopelagicaceae bacterium]|nr:hypothetical protein [Candidatus Nanopelagicaceae bacterium]
MTKTSVRYDIHVLAYDEVGDEQYSPTRMTMKSPYVHNDVLLADLLKNEQENLGKIISQAVNEKHGLVDVKVTGTIAQGDHLIIVEDLGGGRCSVLIARFSEEDAEDDVQK